MNFGIMEQVKISCACLLLLCWTSACLGESDPVKDYLQNYKEHHPHPDRCTDSNGIPYPSLTASQAIETSGPVLLQDRFLIERTTGFNRERIPERVVNAKGVSAHGIFTVTHPIPHWTKAKFLTQPRKTTPIFARLSLTSGELGYPDTLRDARGFAVKFKTEDGNFDLVASNLDVFAVRDPMIFSDMMHSRKRNPQTHLRDPIMFWDFIQQRPETTHHTLKLFSDFTSPESLRMINGSGIHTFVMVNQTGSVVYCKFHLISHQPFRLLEDERAVHLAGTDPSWYFRDMYTALGSGQYPRWTLAIQVATFQQARQSRWDFMDVTKNWPVDQFPLYPVGILELNRNVVTQFAEGEQSAFSPANMVPGIEPSGDPLLAARILSYTDAQRYRLGQNYNQLPVNRPLNPVASYERDGKMCVDDNGGGAPNYFPNSFNGPVVDPAARQKPFFVQGVVARMDREGDMDNYSQARHYILKDIAEEERQRIAKRIGYSLAEVASEEIRLLVFKQNLAPVCKRFATMVHAAMDFRLRNPVPKLPERPLSL